MNNYLILAGPIAIFLTLISIALSLANYKDFNILNNVISDLGNSDSQHLFNASLVLSGILINIFSLTLYKKLKLTVNILFTLLISGISLSMLGIVRTPVENIWNLERLLHWGFALILFLGYPIGMYLVGKQTNLKFSKYYGILLLGVLLFLLFISPSRFIIQVIGIILIYLWILVMSVIAIKRR